jgi:hypothetical protein
MATLRMTETTARAIWTSTSFARTRGSEASRRDPSHWLALVALAGFAAFTIAVAALHSVQPHLHPVTDAISYYIHGANGWWLTVALVGLGAGSLALVASLSLVMGSRSALGQCILMLWGGSILVCAALPADPIEFREMAPSTVGFIHGIAAMIAFAALPLAALILTPVLRPRVGEALLSSFAVLSVACMLSVFLWPVLSANRPPFGLGFTERLFLGFYVGWLATVAMTLAMPGWTRTSPLR